MSEIKKQKWFWLTISVFITCSTIVFGTHTLGTPSARAYDAYDYYPGTTCNGVYGDPWSGIGHPSEEAVREYACPIIRIYPRNKTKLESVVFGVYLSEIPRYVTVCARQGGYNNPKCASKRATRKGWQEIVIEQADLQEVRNFGEHHWNWYLYVRVELGPGDRIDGYKVYWDEIY